MVQAKLYLQILLMINFYVTCVIVNARQVELNTIRFQVLGRQEKFPSTKRISFKNGVQFSLRSILAVKIWGAEQIYTMCPPGVQHMFQKCLHFFNPYLSPYGWLQKKNFSEGDIGQFTLPSQNGTRGIGTQKWFNDPLPPLAIGTN